MKIRIPTPPIRGAFGAWLSVSLCALAALSVTACRHSCEDVYMCPVEGTGGTGGQEATGGGGAGGGLLCPEDPAEVDGAIPVECGVWVSASMGDDGNAGTQGEPVKTIAAGIALAQVATLRVYLCGETYPVAVALYSGISLFGGFDCQNDWRYLGAMKRATIEPGTAGTIPLTLLEGDTPSTIRDVNITAADATDPGGSSIAMLALAGSRVDLRRSEITAGNGADGEPGEDGSHGAPPAPNGLKGNDGADACTMDVGLGGAAVMLGCEDGTTSHSGQGGNGSEGAANDGGDGLQAPDPNPLNYGVGGKGENAASGNACTPGFGGAQGNNGQEGLGAAADGRLTKDGYLGVPGGDGGMGLPGQGGGGGGASIGKATCGGVNGGAGGGSGGSGGCGGRGAKGGQPGGSSIGIASLTRYVHVEQVRIIAGNGGNGGDGGAGQPGGQGGLPGVGGAGLSAADPVKKGCAGGVGGYGGDGGNGGGGRGGHTVYYAFTPGSEPIDGAKDWIVGVPGKGGLGGNPASIPALGDNGGKYVQLLEP